MVVKSKGVTNAYGKKLCSRCFSVMNRNKMSQKNQKKKSSIFSDHNLNKSIITTCIGKCKNSYMLYTEIFLNTIFTHIKSIALPTIRTNFRYILVSAQ
jgi:hypothetical protein